MKIPYVDVADVFEALGGDALLESSDIESKEGLTSIAVLRSSARCVCHGQSVTVTGADAVAYLDLHLADFGSNGHYEFPFAVGADERARLTALSNVEPLRLLQNRRSDSLLVGGFAFDYLDTFETLPEVPEGANTFPDYEFVLAELVLEVDHQHHTAELIGPTHLKEQYAERIREVLSRSQSGASSSGAAAAQPREAHTNSHTNFSDEEFMFHVKHLQEHVRAGDIFQVVPARAFTVPCTDAFAAYRRLRESNPSPYLFYFRGLDYELFGASPESNLKYRAETRRVELYPIAGTQPRGRDHEEDIRLELLLRTDTKEIAEHTMLVDLARNDLARVAKPGSRRVEKLMQVDRYSRVMHLVSLVVAELDEELDALDAYRACMNMGTLTGAPKLRAVDLLRSVEGERRGSYGGAVGYLRGNGDMDTCIVIRSAFVRGGEAVVQAGAGVVRDSIPELEAAETRHKAQAVLEALGVEVKA